MGNTIWIEAEGRAGAETHSDMGKLLRLEPQLDALATRLGVQKLSEFYDYRPLLEANQSEESPDPLPEISWFNSAGGLESVRALRACLEKNFSELRWSAGKGDAHWQNDLIDELRSCEAVLVEALRAGQKFRLMIVP